MKKGVVQFFTITIGIFSFFIFPSFDLKKDQRLSTYDFRLQGPVKLVYVNTFQLAQKNSEELDLPVYSLSKIQDELNDIPEPDVWFMNYGKTSLQYLSFTEKGYLSERTQVFAGMTLDRTVYAYDDAHRLTWGSKFNMGEMTSYSVYKNNRIAEQYDYHGKDDKQAVRPLYKLYEYDSWNGRLKKIVTKELRENKPLFNYEFLYRGDSIIVEQHFEMLDTVIELATLKIDNKGRLLESETHTEGRLNDLEMHTYDKKGFEILRSMYTSEANYTSEVSYSLQEILEKRIHVGEQTPFETYKLVLSRPDEYGNWTLATLYHNQEQEYVILRTIRYY